MSEDHFALWEEDQEPTLCDSDECDNVATYAMIVHPQGIRHGMAFRCDQCMDIICQQNARVLAVRGYVICPLCHARYNTIDGLMRLEKLNE